MNKPQWAAVVVACVAACEITRFAGVESTATIAAVAPAVASALQSETPARGGFPHAAHAGLFPVCTACHAGVAGDDATGMYTVQQRDCARCHDGTARRIVDWSPPTERTGNLKFSHRVHATSGIACSACHNAPEASERMAVTMPSAERCLECHGQTPHTAAATRCDVCHQALTAATQVPPAEIAAYPQPDDHRDPDFVRAHGDAARSDTNRCSVCHSRDSCERCHLNVAQLPAVAALEPDARLRQILGDRPGNWPAPADHAARDWHLAHGTAARADMQGCANCHVQSSCSGCHRDLPAPGIELLPAAALGDTRGVRLSGARPAHHPPGFARDHAAAAGAQALRCDTCHSPSYCSNCHEAAFEPQFHPRDYRHRHAAEAYARDSDCSSCHSTEGFCRDCHASAGIASADSRTAAYHDAHPLWLLDHGRAARQGLDSCASCHQQTDCLQCHSARAGWRINPHGPDFDAGRMGDRSLESCAVCHVADPRRP